MSVDTLLSSFPGCFQDDKTVIDASLYFCTRERMPKSPLATSPSTARSVYSRSTDGSEAFPSVCFLLQTIFPLYVKFRPQQGLLCSLVVVLLSLSMTFRRQRPQGRTAPPCGMEDSLSYVALKIIILRLERAVPSFLLLCALPFSRSTRATKPFFPPRPSLSRVWPLPTS